MSRLEDMQIYVETVDRGGFSAAAERLGLSKQYVSHRMAALEARLGARLLHRTTRKLGVTALGLEYYERAKRVLAEADAADRAVSGQGAQPRGHLRIGKRPALFLRQGNAAPGVIEKLVPLLEHSGQKPLRSLSVLRPQRSFLHFRADDGLHLKRHGNLRVVRAAALLEVGYLRHFVPCLIPLLRGPI